MKEYLIRLARYNVWANAQLSNWLLQISEEQWAREFGGSFKSLSTTALHITSAEKVWFERLEGDPKEFLSVSFQGDRDDVLAVWKMASQNLENYVATISDEVLNEKFTYRNLKGDVFIRERYQALAHVFNHSTYHRGQLVNYLREVGFAGVGSTDLINYYNA